MSKYSIQFSRLLRATVIVGLMSVAFSYTSIADAAQGCGFGYHRTWLGGCTLNAPGPYATPAPLHPGCWRNAWGYLRCY